MRGNRARATSLVSTGRKVWTFRPPTPDEVEELPLDNGNAQHVQQWREQLLALLPEGTTIVQTDNHMEGVDFVLSDRRHEADLKEAIPATLGPRWSVHVVWGYVRLYGRPTVVARVMGLPRTPSRWRTARDLSIYAIVVAIFAYIGSLFSSWST